MKFKYLFYYIYFFVATIHAQKTQETFHVEVGYSKFSLSDLKSFQKEIYKDILKGLGGELDIPIKIVDNFPGYLSYRFEYYNPFFRKQGIGLFLEYNSSGGRIHYSDYSGEISVKQLIQGFSSGISIKNQILPSFTGELYYSIYLDATYNILDIEEKTRLGTSHQESNTQFASLSLGVEPSIYFKKDILENKFFVISFGYRVTHDFGLTLSNNDEAKLKDSSANQVRVQWDGWKISTGIGMYL